MGELMFKHIFTLIRNFLLIDYDQEKNIKNIDIILSRMQGILKSRAESYSQPNIFVDKANSILFASNNPAYAQFINVMILLKVLRVIETSDNEALRAEHLDSLMDLANYCLIDVSMKPRTLEMTCFMRFNDEYIESLLKDYNQSKAMKNTPMQEILRIINLQTKSNKLETIRFCYGLFCVLREDSYKMNGLLNLIMLSIISLEEKLFRGSDYNRSN